MDLNQKHEKQDLLVFAREVAFCESFETSWTLDMYK